MTYTAALSPLFWEHPDGDIVKIPCTHPTTVDRSITITVPGGHFSVADGVGSIDLPSQSVTFKVPLPAWQHPDGDDGPRIPCVHLFPTYAVDPVRNLVFHTNDLWIQNQVKIAIDRLLTLIGVTGALHTPSCPLHIFNRPLLSNYPSGSDNPFWSHYEPSTHAINVHTDASQQNEFRDILHHELGHALVGHSCVKIPSPGGAHSLDGVSQPALAMSEGWAHFVALAIRCDQSASAPSYAGETWEARSSNVATSATIESNVARMLWDLYDKEKSRVIAGHVVFQPDDDPACLPFRELYRVFSPTLATLPDGPIIPNAASFVDRLKSNSPANAAQIDSVYATHCGT